MSTQEAIKVPISAPPSSTRARSNADILNFVAKQQSKSIATKELVRHLAFSVIFLTIVAMQRSVFESYLMNQSLSTAFFNQQIDFDLQKFPKTFSDVHQFDELRDYIVSVLGGTLDQYSSYNGVPYNDYQRNFVMSNNRLLGGIRIRQLRAAPNKGCKVPHELQDLVKSCYAPGYSSTNKDTQPFGPIANPQKYKYQTARETGSEAVYGITQFSFEGGGYVVDMPLDSNFTQRMTELVDDGWWDSATRAIIVTMNFLSVDLRSRVAVMYGILEFPGGGEVFQSTTFNSFRIGLYNLGGDWFRMVFEILFVLLLIHMIVKEIEEMKMCYHTKKGLKKYFYNGWNINEMISIALFTSEIGVYLHYLVGTAHIPNLASREYIPYMEQLASRAVVFYNISYFNILLLLFQTFKYLRMNRRLYMLWKTLQHAGTDLVGFLFIFLIFAFGFIFTAWLAFGSEMQAFSTFNMSFGSCWNFLIGNPPDYVALTQTNPLFGPIFFTLFSIFVFFILANVFIAIVGKSFAVVSRSVDNQLGLKDALEIKLNSCFKSIKKFVRKTTRRPGSNKRSILQILEDLSYPEILEKSDLTLDDVSTACGPRSTQAEARELLEWIQKLESKKKQQTIRKRSISEDEDDDDYDDTMRSGTEMKPVQKSSEYLELVATVNSLREDMKHLLQLLQPQLQQVQKQPPTNPLVYPFEFFVVPPASPDPPVTPPPSPLLPRAATIIPLLPPPQDHHTHNQLRHLGNHLRPPSPLPPSPTSSPTSRRRSPRTPIPPSENPPQLHATDIF